MGLSKEEYVDALEKERNKMAIFESDLPLSLDLVDRAIENYRRREVVMAAAVVEEERCNGGIPVLKEFIPLRPMDADDSKDLEEAKERSCGDDRSEKTNSSSSNDKNGWLKSAQLWNEAENSTSPNKNENLVESVNDEVLLNHHQQQQQQQRKERRCWSTELHRRFVHTLQLLGGPHVATPKQIRQLLQVDGLTNDEVKSHLQKYRLHARWAGGESKTCETQQSTEPLLMWAPMGLTYSNQLLQQHRVQSTAPFHH